MYEQFKRKIQPFINIYHLMKAVLANIWYGIPSQNIKVIGVTGTDGKTTTSTLIYHILKSAGKKTSLISTIFAKVGTDVYDTGLHTTTPDARLVQKLLYTAARRKEEYLVLETTSHALDQNRTAGIRFQVGVITNITHEHLDYHKTYDRYVRAKAKLLLHSKTSVINADDRSFKRLKTMLRKKKKTFYTYSRDHKADFGIDLIKKYPEIFNKLADFNKSNYIAAYSVCSILGISKEEIVKALKSFELPVGRQEIVYKKDFTVVIDFAHTPNSIENVLPALKKLYLKPGGRLIHVFGAAGLRDFTKRQFMGEASGRYADIVVLTEEDYRTEDPYAIAEKIAHGLIKQGFYLAKKQSLGEKHRKTYAVITNRAEAIKTAVLTAKKNDLIVLTGKSHEQSLARGGVEYPWNEKKAVQKAIKQLS